LGEENVEGVGEGRGWWIRRDTGNNDTEIDYSDVESTDG